MLVKKKNLKLSKNKVEKGLSEFKKKENEFFSFSPIVARFRRIRVKDVEKSFRVHNGKSFVGVFVDSTMVNCKFGDLVFTRKVGEIHNLKKKSKKKVIRKK